MRNIVVFVILCGWLIWCSGVICICCVMNVVLLISLLVKFVVISFGVIVLVWMFFGFYCMVRLCVSWIIVVFVIV